MNLCFASGRRRTPCCRVADPNDVRLRTRLRHRGREIKMLIDGADPFANVRAFAAFTGRSHHRHDRQPSPV